MILEADKIEGAVNVALLDKALDLQQELAAQLLETMGIGQNIDIVV